MFTAAHDCRLHPSLHGSRFAYRLSLRSRRVKLRILSREVSDDPKKRILDVGAGGEWEYSENTLEKYYPFPKQIVAVSIEKQIHGLQLKYPDVKWSQANGLNLPFADKTFAVSFANAVIEHITGEDARHRFVGEMLRVARCCIITTPNALFPVEVHSRLPFVHWLPDEWFNRITARLGMGFISKGPGRYFSPITPGRLRSYFPAGENVRIRLGWLGMTLIAICKGG
jgi:SAM-dependent methyltransferase